MPNTHSGLKLVVFDCDGTLVDSQYAIIATMTAAFDRAGLAAPPAEAVRRAVGLSLEAAVARILERHDGAAASASDGAKVQEIADAYRESFLELRLEPDYHEPLFPGVHDVLRHLNETDVLMGIATGKGMRGLMMSLERHGIAHHFVTLQTADTGPGKPHPGMMQQAMTETGAAPADTVLVGDTVFDIEMARNAGVSALGVSWGYHPPNELVAAGAADILDGFAELVPALSRMWKDWQ